jgi:hypothetical protein
MAKTKDNGLILAGGTWNGGIDNQGLGLLVKLDAQRKTQWHQTYNNPPWEGSYQERALASVAQTGEGGYLAVSRDALVKVDPSDRVQWSMLDFDEGLGNIASVTATKDGGFIVVGSLNDDVWLAKFAQQSNDVPNETNNSPNELNSLSTVLIVALVVVVIIETTLLLAKFRKERKNNKPKNAKNLHTSIICQRS